MMLLLILASAAGVAAAFGRGSGWPNALRRGLAVAMVFAGFAHLAKPDPFLAHLPTWMPARDPIVAITGVIELAFGAALLGPAQHRRSVGRLLAAYLVAVVPANVYVAVADVDVSGQPGGVYRWLRLPVQLLLVWIALRSTTDTANLESTDPADVSRDATEPALS
ncbi:MAG: DoxX family protein [Candidatus Limnocylindrales bacterium]